jgi:3-hydroxyisobutyrate dehydrogenase-like beta-hydroxyacid dehydrogenase
MSQQKPDHITLPAAHALGEDAQAQVPFSRPSTPVPAHDRWGFVGLGNMGAPMALNLAKNLKEQGQPPLMVWNRSGDRVDKFTAMAEKESVPVQVAADLQEIGRTCDYILTSLGSDQAAIEVYAELFKGQETQSDKGDGIIPGGRGKSTIFVDTSTVSSSRIIIPAVS